MLKVLLAVGAALLVGVALLVRVLEPRLAFFPTAGEQDTPASLGLPFRPHTLHTGDGETLAAWLLPHPAPRAFVLYLHGNGGNLSIWLPVLASVQRQGYTVAAIDYRGYGRSTGRPSEAGLYRDVDAALAWLATLDRPAAPFLIWGRSLGTTMAAYAATRRRPDGLILESGFTDARRLVRASFPLRLLSTLSSYRFPTGRYAQQAGCPVLVLHGDADRVIPFALGEELFAALPDPKQFVRLVGTDHNDLAPPGAERYWGAIAAFVDRLNGPHPPRRPA